MIRQPAPALSARRIRFIRRTRPGSVVVAVLCALLAAVLGGLIAAPAARADSIRDKEYWLADYGIQEAWKTSQGEGVKVAVIDTGIDSSHPDLKGAVVGGTDVSGAGAAEGQKGLGDAPEHGTLVATLLAGRGHGSTNKQGIGADGVVGVAPKAQLLSVSTWLGSSNPGGVSVADQIPYAVRWAVDNGARVINMSLGSSSPAWPESWDQAFLYAEQHDVVIVAAAGNRGVGMVQVGAPATIPGVLTVAGLDRNGKASWDASSQGISIAVAAPAENLVGGLPGGFYADWSGTSGAAPLVSGVAALIRAKYPDMSAAQVINRIISTAKDEGAPGQDPLYGYGVLDAAAAVTADVPVVEQNPLGDLAEWIRVHRRGEPAQTTPAPEPTVTPVPDIPVPDAPVAEPAASTSPVGPVVVLGGAGLVFLVVVAGGAHTLYARRAGRRPATLHRHRENHENS